MSTDQATYNKRTIIRWGFVSTAEVGRKNWRAIALSGNGRVTAVASASKERAEEFVDACQKYWPFEQRPVSYASFNDMISSNDVDAVYVPLPTALRKKIVVAAANAGKHVMCEKPCSPTANDLEEMVAACRRSGVRFADGDLFARSERFERIRKAVDDLGHVRRVTCQFSFRASRRWLNTNVRLNSELEPQGCLGDLGWYCVRFILWTMRWETPDRIDATILREIRRAGSPKPVPIEFSAELFFSNNASSASFYCSFVAHHQRWASVSGTRANLRVSDFATSPHEGDATRFDEDRADLVVARVCDRETVGDHETTNGEQETELFRTFNESVLSGHGTADDECWTDASLKTQRVCDRCMEVALHKKRLDDDPG